jgi:transposase
MQVNIGVDLHKTQFTVFGRVDAGFYGKYGTDERGYRDFLKEIQSWQDRGYTVRVGVESTGNTRYFKNRMEKAGCEVVVINTLKFKVVNESVKKTDRHDAATIAEFLEKDMLPTAHICSQENEDLRRLLTTREKVKQTVVAVKNQIHSMLVSLGIEDAKASLQSKKGRQKILDTLRGAGNELVAQQLIETIDVFEHQVKKIESQLEHIARENAQVQLLQTIPGCGLISSLTIVAYIDDIARFGSAKKLVSYCGLAPWVQNSNETVHHGKITKHGPKQLRTALVQVVLGMVRLKTTTASYRIMQRYEAMKKQKGSGKTIIASARKIATIIWVMLQKNEPFKVGYMIQPVRLMDSEASHINAAAG